MKRETILDLLVIVSVVIVLLLLFLLPEGWKNTLILHRNSTTLWGIIGNSYVHQEISHILSNVVAYLVVTMAMYGILIRLEMRRTFYKVFLVDVLVLPTVISLIWVPVDKWLPNFPNDSLGFSGAVASLVGGLVLSLLIFYHVRYGFRVDYGVATSLFFLLFLFTWTYGFAIGWYGTVLYSAILILFVVYFLLYSRTGQSEIVSPSGKVMPPIARIVFLMVPEAVILLFTVFFFPTQVVIGKSEVNVEVHYIGIVVGLITAFFLKGHLVVKGSDQEHLPDLL